jgi:peroxidase
MRGYELPSPRNIVRKVFLNKKRSLNVQHALPNMLFLLFGQLIKHDTGSKQISQNVEPRGIRCCAHLNKHQLSPSLTHSSCLPIVISRSDTFYSPKNVRCMDFVRSNIVSNDPHRVKVGEQLNRVTAYLDLSVIYGSDAAKLARMRSFNGGRFKTNPGNVLPTDNGTYCSGDMRASQTKFFTVVQSLFVRSHNEIADKLAVVNPGWDEERLFQEARRANIAVYQRLLYKEWLPLLIGEEAARRLDNIVFNPDTDASTLNEFSNAAFRFMHSFLPSEFELRDKVMKVKRVSTSDALIEDENVTSYENTLRGLIHQNISTGGYSSEILNKLFKNDEGVGLDLLSIDILRGRDHGIPPYHRYRKYCDVKPFQFKVFNDLAPWIQRSSIVQLRQTYKTVYDIDLLVGGALEEIEEGAGGVLGPTFKCLALEQFYRWKAGDFYFYNHGFGEGGLNNGELSVFL